MVALPDLFVGLLVAANLVVTFRPAVEDSCDEADSVADSVPYGVVIAGAPDAASHPHSLPSFVLVDLLSFHYQGMRPVGY